MAQIQVSPYLLPLKEQLYLMITTFNIWSSLFLGYNCKFILYTIYLLLYQQLNNNYTHSKL